MDLEKMRLQQLLPSSVPLSSLLVLVWKARTRLGGCCTRVQRGCPRVGAAFELFFFFFFWDSRQLGLIHADLASICTEPGWFGQNRAISAGDRNGRNRPKSALNLAGTAEILTSEDRMNRFCLLLSLFCESKIVMYFLIIF